MEPDSEHISKPLISKLRTLGSLSFFYFYTYNNELIRCLSLLASAFIQWAFYITFFDLGSKKKISCSHIQFGRMK